MRHSRCGYVVALYMWALALCFGVFLTPPEARTQSSRLDLYIGYTLPTNPDLAGPAKRAEGDAVQQRALMVRACGDDLGCQRQQEIGFRLQISSIPSVTIKIAYCFPPDCATVRVIDRQLYGDTLTNLGLNQTFGHIDFADRYVATGAYVEFIGKNCRLRKSDGGGVISADSFMCELVRWDFTQAASAGLLDLVKRLERIS